MIERLGYYKNFDYDYVSAGNSIIVTVSDRLSYYKDALPKKGMGDCYRLGLIDGTLVVEKWNETTWDFSLVVASNLYTITNN